MCYIFKDLCRAQIYNYSMETYISIEEDEAKCQLAEIMFEHKNCLICDKKIENNIIGYKSCGPLVYDLLLVCQIIKN